MRSRIFFVFFLNFFRSFRGNSSNKFDFGHRSGALDRSGSRELRAVKIPASYDAWRPPERRKNDSGENQFFWVSEISFSSCFLDLGGNFREIFCSRYTYSEVHATENCEKTICAARTWPPRAPSARAQIYI